MPTNSGVLKQYNSSIVSTQVVRALRSATVIVDAEQADGTLLDSVASYTAMVALAELNGDPPPPRNSTRGCSGAAPHRERHPLDSNQLSRNPYHDFCCTEHNINSSLIDKSTQQHY